MDEQKRIWNNVPSAFEKLVLTEIGKRFWNDEPVLVDGVLRNLSARRSVPNSAAIAQELAADSEKVKYIFEAFSELGLIDDVDKNASQGLRKGTNYSLSEIGLQYVAARLDETEKSLPVFAGALGDLRGPLKPEQFERVVKAIAPFFDLEYFKFVRVPREEAVAMAKEIADKLKDAQALQKERGMALIGKYDQVPEGSLGSTLYNIESLDLDREVRTGDWQGNVALNYRPAYKSIGEAIDNEFSWAIGHLKLDRHYDIKGQDSKKYASHFPIDIRINRQAPFIYLERIQIEVNFASEENTLDKQIKVLRPGSEIWREPLEYQLAGFRMIERLKDSLDIAMAQIREKGLR
jgi:hypothetical protein